VVVVIERNPPPPRRHYLPMPCSDATTICSDDRAMNTYYCNRNHLPSMVVVVVHNHHHNKSIGSRNRTCESTVPFFGMGKVRPGPPCRSCVPCAVSNKLPENAEKSPTFASPRTTTKGTTTTTLENQCRSQQRQYSTRRVCMYVCMYHHTINGPSYLQPLEIQYETAVPTHTHTHKLTKERVQAMDGSYKHFFYLSSLSFEHSVF
jgi:hypothetical protein